MPRTAAGDADIDALPRAYTKGHGRDTSWHEDAKCLGANHGGPFVRAWQAEEGVPFTLPDGTVVPGVEMEKVALTICATCPAQWDCADWAASVPEDHGIWAMKPADLRWLVKQADKLDIVGRARTDRRAVQFAVSDARNG